MFGPFRKQEQRPEAAGETAASETGTEVAPQAGEAAPGADAAPSDDRPLEERIVEALKTIYDPEIPVNIYELGLIYDVALPEDPAGKVGIKMTLTSPHCPVAESLPGDVKRRVEKVDGVAEAEVEVVWDPAWNPDMMSEAAKLELGFF